MARTFTAAFQALQTNKSAKPYLILEVQWGGATGTKYYLDRLSTDYSAAGLRVPASGIGTSKVIQWGSVGLSLKEGQVGGTDQVSVVLEDKAGELTAILALEAKQRKTVKLWRLFDDSTTVWPTDAALMMQGTMRPFTWDQQENKITLSIDDGSAVLAKDISHVAKATVFTSIPPESQDKSIPLVWGTAFRVPALLISRPWETTILQAVDGSVSFTVEISEHPDDMGLSSGIPYDAWLGADPVTVTFNQSVSPDTLPSTVTIASTSTTTIASGNAVYVFDIGTGRRLIIPDVSVRPLQNKGSLESLVGAGDPCMVFLSDPLLTPSTTPPLGWNTTTVTSIAANTPWPGHYSLLVADNNVMAKALGGAQVRFLGGTTYRRPWPAGTILRARTGKYIYAANALPSKQVLRVEGYGTIPDDSGEERDGFVYLGGFTNDLDSGGSCLENRENDDFIINLNDSTWASSPGGGFGRNITTISFSQAPRNLCPYIKDNRIWVTLRGVDSTGDSLGSLVENPANVIKEYLQNTYLMGLAAGSINTASFTTAATSLSAMKVGYVQTEPKRGLDLLQDLARQFRSVLLFDQGQVYISVLSNTPGTSIKTFDTSGNDNILEGSLQLSESSVDDVANELSVTWQRYWHGIEDEKGRQYTAHSTNAASIAVFGKVTRDLVFDSFWRRSDVETEVAFWLARWTSIWQVVRFTAFHDGLQLQPNDEITVTFVDGEGRTVLSAQKMWVINVRSVGIEGLVEVEARYIKFSY